MKRKFTGFFILACTLAGLVPLSCKPGGVGDPCTPEDEYDVTFPGFDEKEVNVENKSFQCETRVCLVNHFRGRVSCPYGQGSPYDPAIMPVPAPPTPPTKAACWVPGHSDKDEPTGAAQPDGIQIEVPAQITARRADQVVYCSCRCDGPDKNARYCKCPSGYSCTQLVDQLGIQAAGRSQLAGSYCIKEGTAYQPQALVTSCNRTSSPCE